MANQFSLILNQLGVENRLLSFVHFAEGGSKTLTHYAEHGHFEMSQRSKYSRGLTNERQSKRSSRTAGTGTASTRNSILHPSVDTRAVRRKFSNDV